MKNHSQMLKYVFIFLLIVINISYSQSDINNFKTNDKKENNLTSSKSNDSLLIYYQSILEKTNSQLNLVWNPFGITIMILGILFTIAASLVGLAIYKNSDESKKRLLALEESYKENFNSSIQSWEKAFEDIKNEYQRQLESFQNDKSEIFDSYKITLKDLIEEYKDKSNPDNTPNKDNSVFTDKIEKLQKKIEEFEIQQKKSDQLKSEIIPKPVIPKYENLHTCSNCKNTFVVIDNAFNNLATSAVASISPFGYKLKELAVQCPKCGQHDKYYH